ncbi:DUF4123 domain-containing protein [Enterovibrio baiacu]|uniref:DUF4123 domain-containing protein n=1 Tax=Enterovibrio baiacu TaxID=2491023 RepID=UPI003D10BA1C
MSGKSVFPQPVPDMSLDSGSSLYLVLDGSQISELEKKLYSLLGNPEFEPIYLYQPWDQISEVTPCVVKTSEKLIDWFFSDCIVNQGYFIASSASCEQIADSMRALIQVKSPYGSDVFFKMAHAEASWILFDDEHPLIWKHIEAVWIPTRLGWKHRVSPQKPVPEKVKYIELNSEQWKKLGEISWRNTLDKIQKYVIKWFYTQLPNPSYEWLNDQATLAYNKGFSSERDLMLYFSILGFLGANALDKNLYPDIQELVDKSSLLTPSQRIEEAAELAEHHAKYRNLQERNL